MNIPFWKMSGAGNDFVLLEGMPKGRRGPALAKTLCDRHTGIGADGLLVLSRRAGTIRLDYWNADGSAAFCGNGSRCGVVWAAQRGWLEGKRFSLTTNRGELTARLTGKGRAEVAMPVPSKLRLGLNIKVKGGLVHAHYVDTGVPHAIVFADDINKISVGALGRELRFHKIFGRLGANVNFVEITNDVLFIRTYERGVEAETLACGTGIVAAAFVSRLLGHDASPVRVQVRGGDILTVSFEQGPHLEGPARIVFSGEVDL